MTGAPLLHPRTALRWGSMTISEQLANVGSEVERVLRAQDAGNTGRLEHALDRALELFDLTATDPRWRGARRREILRAREELCARVYGAEPPPAEPMRRYYLAFAKLARR